MRRRAAIGFLATAATWPRHARAQRPAKVYRVGLLSNDAHTGPNARAFWDAFRSELRRLGWPEGEAVAFELADSNGYFDRLPGVARELVTRRLDLIVVAGGLASIAVRDATKTIPVVFVAVSDAVGTGLVTTMARPGGNVTGLTDMSGELYAKRLQFLTEVMPDARRIAYLTYETGVTWPDEEAARAASALGLQWREVKVTRQEDLAAAVAGLSDADAWFVGDPIRVFPRDQVVQLLAAHRRPAVYPSGSFVRAGGLMSYAANPFALVRRAAWYVDQILRGARPADLPVEQPTTFELVVNLATARAQGIAIPPSVLLRADEVIE